MAELSGGNMAEHQSAWSRMPMGDIEIFSFLDAESYRRNPHMWFGLDVPPAEFETSTREFDHRILDPSSNYVPCLIRSANTSILFDTGLGWSADGEQKGGLTRQMTSAGFLPTEIDVVVISHGHPDHIGGLLDASGQSNFANARILVGRREFRHWMGTSPVSPKRERTRHNFRRIFQCLSGQVELIGDEGPILPGIRSCPTLGHSPGHLSFLVTSGQARLLVLGDVATHSFFSFRRTLWHASVDDDAPAAAETRSNVLEWAARENLLVSAFHLPYPGLGRVRKDGTGYAWLPELQQ